MADPATGTDSGVARQVTTSNIHGISAVSRLSLQEQRRIIKKVAENTANEGEMLLFEGGLKYGSEFGQLVSQSIQKYREKSQSACFAGAKRQNALRLVVARERVHGMTYRQREGARLPPHGDPLLPRDKPPRPDSRPTTRTAHSSSIISPQQAISQTARQLGQTGRDGCIGGLQRLGRGVRAPQATSQRRLSPSSSMEAEAGGVEYVPGATSESQRMRQLRRGSRPSDGMKRPVLEPLPEHYTTEK